MNKDFKTLLENETIRTHFNEFMSCFLKENNVGSYKRLMDLYNKEQFRKPNNLDKLNRIKSLLNSPNKREARLAIKREQIKKSMKEKRDIGKDASKEVNPIKKETLINLGKIHKSIMNSYSQEYNKMD